MALGFYFSPDSFSAATYDECIRRLDQAGAAAPPGRLYHSAFTVGDGIHVFDVWDSQESFEAFGKTLVPIMADLGADPGTPSVHPIHNIIQG
jgi:hypothetical protein